MNIDEIIKEASKTLSVNRQASEAIRCIDSCVLPNREVIIQVLTDIKKAISVGASNVTHTYNAQTALHHREIGTVGSAMLIDELNCELIADTIHVSVPAMK